MTGTCVLHSAITYAREADQKHRRFNPSVPASQRPASRSRLTNAAAASRLPRRARRRQASGSADIGLSRAWQPITPPVLSDDSLALLKHFVLI